MAQLSNDWLEAINSEFKKDYYKDLFYLLNAYLHIRIC